MTNACAEWVKNLVPSAGCEQRVDGTWVLAPQIDVQVMARTMSEAGYRLSTMTGLALPEGETAIIYHFVMPGSAIHVKTHTQGGSIPSITNLVAAASWIEREIHDFFGVSFPGHPNLAPLLRPAELREGFFRDGIDATAPLATWAKASS